MSSDWEELPSGDLISRDPGGTWTLLKTAQGWTPVPPSGRSYPFALVASMMQAPCLPSMKHAIQDCRAFLSMTVGDEQLKKDGCARTPSHLAFQFVVTSCGVTFSVQRGKGDAVWIAEWAAWDRFGALKGEDLADLVGRFRTPFSQDAGYTPPGFREALIAEDQRIEGRLWALGEFSAAVAACSSEACALDGRAKAYGEVLTQQAKDEARLMERRADADIYLGLL
jgi:hypothetical protein